MISGYLKELAQALSFDPALSARILREVSDHLEEAVAAERANDRHEAERRAIERFGNPRELAAEFAAVSLARHARRAGIVIVLASLAVLGMMKTRVAWYAVVQRTIPEDLASTARLVLAIDRYAFWLAVGAGVGAILYLGHRRTPVRVHPEYRRHLQRAVFLFVCATAFLAISVINDLVLTAFQLDAELCAGSIIPLASVSVELACIGVIVLLIMDATRRIARTTTSLQA